MAQIKGTNSSRFANISKGRSFILLLLLSFAMLVSFKAAMYGAWVVNEDLHPEPSTNKRVESSKGDIALYQAINYRIENGQNYYSAALEEQRLRAYPTKPFLTVRLPTLALVITHANKNLMIFIFIILNISILFAWLQQIYNTFPNSVARICAIMLIPTGLVLGVVSEAHVLHEIWAGILIALSLGLYRPQKFWPAILAAAVALAVRETALPYIMLMAAFALFERRLGEFAAWVALIGIFVCGLLAHALIVNSLALPTDLISPGWLRFGGIRAAVLAMSGTTLLLVFPRIIGGMLIPLALFGWLSWRNSIGARGALYIAGYGFMLTIIGRESNFYWGLMVAPLLLLGLAFVPRALTDILHNFTSGKATGLA